MLIRLKFNIFNVHIFLIMIFNLLLQDLERARTDPRARLKRVNLETKEALKELDETYKAPEKKEEAAPKADTVNAAPYSTGKIDRKPTSI